MVGLGRGCSERIAHAEQGLASILREVDASSKNKTLEKELGAFGMDSPWV